MLNNLLSLICIKREPDKYSVVYSKIRESIILDEDCEGFKYNERTSDYSSVRSSESIIECEETVVPQRRHTNVGEFGKIIETHEHLIDCIIQIKLVTEKKLKDVLTDFDKVIHEVSESKIECTNMVDKLVENRILHKRIRQLEGEIDYFKSEVLQTKQTIL